jgi:uncharacterized protein YutE (UPF0331/DUF86 family)
MNYDIIRIKTELSVGKTKLQKLITAYNELKINPDNEFAKDSLQFNFIHYTEFMIKICEHLCAKNGLYEANMTSQDKIASAISLSFIKKTDKNTYISLVSLRNRLVHEYWIPKDEEILKTVDDNLNSLKAFYNATFSLVKN